jgi:hypothetical protein
MTPEQQQDGLLDALALLRAVDADDNEAVHAVAQNMTRGDFTAVVLASALLGHMRFYGDSVDALADEWRKLAGL